MLTINTQLEMSISSISLMVVPPLRPAKKKKTTLCDSIFPSQNTHVISSLVCSLGISSREDRGDLVRSSSHTPSNKAHILAMPQFGLRDNLIKCELLKKEELYTFLENYRYVVVYCFLCQCGPE